MNEISVKSELLDDSIEILEKILFLQNFYFYKNVKKFRKTILLNKKIFVWC